jgi:hypothetical protein
MNFPAEFDSVAMGNDDICPDASWKRSLQGRQLAAEPSFATS